MTNKATTKEMRECNAVLEYALNTSDRGVYFSSSCLTWDEMAICTISDASFGNDKIIINDDFEDGRSQQGYIVALASPSISNDKESIIHPICWSSTTITRACRSTLMAKAQRQAHDSEHL
jgi:hypothetical protein